jgi:hypothetical protein
LAKPLDEAPALYKGVAQRVAALEVFESATFVRENEGQCRRAAATALVDELLRRGVIAFDTSEEVCLCNDGYEPPGPPRCAMRATVKLAQRAD